MSSMIPQWLAWVRRLQSLAQNGFTYSENPFDRERYQAVQQIAAEIAGFHSATDPGLLLELFSLERGPSTPKIDVRAAVFTGGEILLVREREDGLWTLPGGWVDVGESPAEAATREVREESGYSCRPVKLLAVWDKNKHDHPPSPYHVYKLVFLCELLGGEPMESLETSAAVFFAEERLPPLSLSRVTLQQMHRLFAHFRHPDWPTDFD